MYSNFLKRIVDFLGALVLFIMLSPLFILISILLAISFRGSPFFVQKRPGMNEHLFSIVKFKTMNDNVDTNGELLPDGMRLTPVGRFVRKTSLDEIPQLLNVLKGDMSFIGPRPLLVNYLPYYTERERKRHSVRPGITGLAQVSGRNMLWWDDRLEKDVEYVEKLSFVMDLNILIKTVKNVLSSKDIEVDPHSKMPNLTEYRTKN